MLLTLRLPCLAIFAPAAAQPAVAEDSGLGLSKVVFAFDFSGSIFCYKDGQPIPKDECKDPNLNEDLADAVDSLAEKIDSYSELYEKRAIDFKIVKFGSGATVIEKLSGEACEGNTSNSVALLIDCLSQIAEDYRDPKKELGGTKFVPSLNELLGTSGRCGIILFTDGEPSDDCDYVSMIQKFKKENPSIKFQIQTIGFSYSLKRNLMKEFLKSIGMCKFGLDIVLVYKGYIILDKTYKMLKKHKSIFIKIYYA